MLHKETFYNNACKNLPECRERTSEMTSREKRMRLQISIEKSFLSTKELQIETGIPVRVNN